MEVASSKNCAYSWPEPGGWAHVRLQVAGPSEEKVAVGEIGSEEGH